MKSRLWLRVYSPRPAAETRFIVQPINSSENFLLSKVKSVVQHPTSAFGLWRHTQVHTHTEFIIIKALGTSVKEFRIRGC